TCGTCGRFVCAACLLDWTGCERRVPIEVRLGTGSRLRDVEPTGRLGLVSHWRRRARLLDLRRLCWITTAVKPPRWRSQMALTRDGAIIESFFVPAPASTSPNAPQAFAGLRRVWLARRAVEVWGDVGPIGRGLEIGRRGTAAWYVRSDETMQLLHLDAPAPLRASHLAPLPGKVVQSVHLDEARGLVAAGSWAEVALYRIEEERLALLSAARLGSGDVPWIAIAGPRLVALVVSQTTATLRSWALGQPLRRSGEQSRAIAGRALPLGSATPDGRFVALARGDRTIELHDLERQDALELEGHTDDVCLVRFVADGRLLVTADLDNRVILRPRGPGGFSGAVTRRPIEPEGLPLAEALAPARR
ncbi:MAG TPA: hypothetical protein VKZ63_18665, partial [Kofleriaceae bacterium]|nr:hypothetical protein [Kofleriaceae bacterium]